MKNGCDCFLNWSDTFAAGVLVVGGKGWNLSRLARYGFKVPAGGVLFAQAYQVFIKENNLIGVLEDIRLNVNHANVGNQETTKNLAMIRELINQGNISASVQQELISNLAKTGLLDKALAIRSSAIAEDTTKASFAGIHESFLNVQGIEGIFAAIKGCYASLWTPQAVAYRRKMNISDDEAMQAVVIMEMVEAQAAGVGFTCNPQTGQEDLVLITANFGLGESIVSGMVQPDEYCLNTAFAIEQKKLGRKEGKTVVKLSGGTQFVESPASFHDQVLSDANMRKLALLIQRVYDALGDGEQHQDIEWVYDGQDFYLVQARPLTALPRYTFDALKNQPDIWSNANLRDSWPMVQSTLNWSLGQQLPQGMDTEFGYKSPPGLQHIKLKQGRAYFNLSLQQWILYDALGMAPESINAALGGHQPEIAIADNKPYRGIKGLQRMCRILKLLRLISQTKKTVAAHFEKLDRFDGAVLKENLVNLNDRDLINRLADTRVVLREFIPVFSASNMAADINQLIKALEKHFPGQGQTLANRLMTGRGDICSAQHGYRLLELAEMAREDSIVQNYFKSETYNPLNWQTELPEESVFKQSFHCFLTEYGHRGIYEMDIINPRWREDPSYLLNYIKSSLETAHPGSRKDAQKENSDEVTRELKARLSAFRYRAIMRSLEQTVQGMELREMAKSELVRLYGTVRYLSQEIGHRLLEREILQAQSDVYCCTWNELIAILNGAWNGQGLDVLVKERKLRRAENERLSPPDYIIDDVPHFEEAMIPNRGNALQGMGVSAGRASGPARILYHPDQGVNLQAGDVLVAHSTDPGWTPLFLKAAAIVVETGGVGSHGSIVAREYGLPAVVNIPGVMRIVKDGQTLLVDGNEGTVYI